jgi:iron-sulfur cluster repair protein YtfE (RIC family)
MDATDASSSKRSPCADPLKDLETPMINTMVECLESEHRKLDEHILQLALAATRLASTPSEPAAKARALEAWDDIRRELWSHLQSEDELVFSWAAAHQALSPTLLATLKVERQEMRSLLAALPDQSSGESCRPEANSDTSAFAKMLRALAQNLDSHIERYDTDVLPSILRAVFHK